MKNIFFAAGILLAGALAGSCNKSEVPAEGPGEVSTVVLAKVAAFGLNNKHVYKADGGYIAEGDIFVDDATLGTTPQNQLLVSPNEEHYRTTNLVTGLPRTIGIRYTGATASISTAINAAITRFNVLNLQLRFARVTSGGHIIVSNVSGTNYIATSGFPAGGNPYNSIRFNTDYAGWQPGTLTTLIAHHIGHCIGFRHTDFTNPAPTCNGVPISEGTGGIGAIHIPGTPTTADPNSWMLGCITNGVDRPFTASDKVALNYLY